jgi:hypothetical protein
MLVISIILEAAVAIIAILAARKGKPYIYGLAFTFGAYVLYDLARLLQWDVQGGVLSGLFLLATITALIARTGAQSRAAERSFLNISQTLMLARIPRLGAGKWRGNTLGKARNNAPAASRRARARRSFAVS